MAHLADADGTPILQDGFFNQGETSGCAKPLISWNRFIIMRADLLYDSSYVFSLERMKQLRIIGPSVSKHVKYDLYQLPC